MSLSADWISGRFEIQFCAYDSVQGVAWVSSCGLVTHPELGAGESLWLKRPKLCHGAPASRVPASN